MPIVDFHITSVTPMLIHVIVHPHVHHLLSLLEACCRMNTVVFRPVLVTCTRASSFCPLLDYTDYCIYSFDVCMLRRCVISPYTQAWHGTADHSGKRWKTWTGYDSHARTHQSGMSCRSCRYHCRHFIR